MARRCVEKKVVSRKDGGTQTVCAKYESTPEEILVRSDDDEQVGVKVDILSGLNLDFSSKKLLPPVVAATVVEGSTLLLRKYVKNPTVKEWAPAISGLIGVASSIPMAWWKGQQAAQSAAMTALLVGGAHQVYELVRDRTQWGAGLGLVVPQQVRGLTMERVGSLPALPAGNQALPSNVRSSVDVSAYGKV